jgi:hypothetical protein
MDSDDASYCGHECWCRPDACKGAGKVRQVRSVPGWTCGGHYGGFPEKGVTSAIVRQMNKVL